MNYIKIFVSLFLMILFLNINAQTKKETEDWLIFNLNKYLRDDFFLWSKSGSNYSWHSTSYEINGGKFIYTTSTFDVTPANRPGGIITQIIRTTIDLTKIIKVSQENNGEDHTNFYLMKLNFNFANTYDYTHLPVRIYDELNKKELNDKYELIYQIDFYRNDPLNDDLPARLTKAFTHLAELNGAKIIKDVF